MVNYSVFIRNERGEVGNVAVAGIEGPLLLCGPRESCCCLSDEARGSYFSRVLVACLSRVIRLSQPGPARLMEMCVSFVSSNTRNLDVRVSSRLGGRFQVAFQFRLSTISLHAAVSALDVCLSKVAVPRCRLQLLGVVCAMIQSQVDMRATGTVEVVEAVAFLVVIAVDGFRSIPCVLFSFCL